MPAMAPFMACHWLMIISWCAKSCKIYGVFLDVKGVQNLRNNCQFGWTQWLQGVVHLDLATLGMIWKMLPSWGGVNNSGWCTEKWWVPFGNSQNSGLHPHFLWIFWVHRKKNLKWQISYSIIFPCSLVNWPTLIWILWMSTGKFLDHPAAGPKAWTSPQRQFRPGLRAETEGGVSWRCRCHRDGEKCVDYLITRADRYMCMCVCIYI